MLQRTRPPGQPDGGLRHAHGLQAGLAQLREGGRGVAQHPQRGGPSAALGHQVKQEQEILSLGLHQVPGGVQPPLEALDDARDPPHLEHPQSPDQGHAAGQQVPEQQRNVGVENSDVEIIAFLSALHPGVSLCAHTDVAVSHIILSL